MWACCLKYIISHETGKRIKKKRTKSKKKRKNIMGKPMLAC
jgi:hypothetical protein